MWWFCLKWECDYRRKLILDVCFWFWYYLILCSYLFDMLFNLVYLIIKIRNVYVLLNIDWVEIEWVCMLFFGVKLVIIIFIKVGFC